MASIIRQIKNIVKKLPWTRTTSGVAKRYIVLYNENGIPVGRVSTRAFKFDDKYKILPFPKIEEQSSSSDSSVSSSSCSSSC